MHQGFKRLLAWLVITGRQQHHIILKSTTCRLNLLPSPPFPTPLHLPLWRRFIHLAKP